MGCRCGGGAEHEHVEETGDLSSLKSLHTSIDINASSALNVKNPEILTAIIRDSFLPFSKNVLRSDTDDQILLKIQYNSACPLLLLLLHRFSGTVKIKAISVMPSPLDAESFPRSLKVFVNMPDISFNSAETKVASQSFELVDPSSVGSAEGPILYPTKIFKFSHVNHITLLLSTSNSDHSAIDFIGFFGDFLYNRIGVVNAVYESKPMAADHKQETMTLNSFQPGI